jgi:serine/threonine protein kinase
MHTNPQQLEQLLVGELSAAETERLQEHLSSCEDCQQTLSGVESQYNTVIVQLRERPPQDHYTVEPACQEMISRAAQYHVSSLAETTGLRRPDAAPREMLRDYRLLKPLGSGGMGAVYQALHTKLNRVVAIKLLPPDKLTATAVARFEREMQIIGQLEHPMIVRATDAGVDDGIPFLVMELIEGIDLERLVRDRGPLSVSAACVIVQQAALGLQHAFERNVIHRDLKPSNLMLGRAPHGGWQVKILDLGLALFEKPLFSAEELTSDGQLMGTVDFMAPEQGENTHAVDIRADIYSLGATLFKLLTGRPPLADGSRTTTLKKLAALASIDPPDVRTWRPDVPAELALLIQRMLSKAPEHRPARPVELADLLEPFATGTDLSAVGQDASGLPQLGFVRLQTPVSSASKSGPSKSTRRWLGIAIGAASTAAVLLAVLVFQFRTKEGVIVVQLETPTPIERIQVDDQQAEWSHSDDQRTYRLKVAPGAVSTVIMTTRDGTEWRVSVPPGGLTVVSGKSYTLTASSPALPLAKEPAVSVDRAVAAWVHLLGGTVELSGLPQGLVRIGPRDSLPEAEFEVEILDLTGVAVTDADLTRIQGLRRLTLLNLNETPVGDVGLSHLRDLPQLRGLYLSRTQVGDNGVKTLASRHSGIEILHAIDSHVSDDGLTSLVSWPMLSELHLAELNLTDAAVETLTKLSRLKSVNLQQTRTTRPGVDQLRTALPGCLVQSDFGTFYPAPVAGAAALWFDGEGDYVDIPTLKYDGSHPLTIEVSVRRHDPPDLAGAVISNALTWEGPAFASLDWGRTTGWHFSMKTDRVIGATFNEPQPPPTQIAAVWDGRQLALYFDGHRVASLDAPGGPVAPADFGHFVIGAVQTRDRQHRFFGFKGIIDEVRLSKVARYTDHYQPVPRLSTDEHTLALYHFDEGDGAVLHDSSGNNQHGTIHGAVWVKKDP